MRGIRVTRGLKREIRRLLKVYRFVVIDSQGVRGTGDRQVATDGTILSQRMFHRYNACGWPAEF